MANLRFFALGCALVLEACGKGSDASPDTGNDSAIDTTPPPCSEPVDERPPESVCVKHVIGKVTDLTGKPFPMTKDREGVSHGVSISVCGNTCFYGETIADGSFDAIVGRFLPIDTFALLVHARPDHASVYITLPKPDASDVITMGDPIKLPDLPATGPLITNGDGKPSSATITSGDISLTFPTGLQIDRDIEDIALDTLNDKGKTLRTVRVPLTDVPPFAKDQNLVALWALSPFDAKFTDGKTTKMKAAVSIANPDKAKLTPGMKVDFIVQGDELTGTPFTGGKAIRAAQGVVSTDGNTIASNSGEGCAYITWLGVRPTP